MRVRVRARPRLRIRLRVRIRLISVHSMTTRTRNCHARKKSHAPFFLFFKKCHAPFSFALHHLQYLVLTLKYYSPCVLNTGILKYCRVPCIGT